MSPTVLNPTQTASLVAFGLFFLALGGLVYGRLFRHLQSSGGAVRAHLFGLPEALVAGVLATFFSALVVRAALKQSAADEISGDQILPSSLMFVAFVVGLCGFLSVRRFDLRELFGVGRFPALQTLGWAALLLIAAFPFIGAANALTVSVLGSEATEQALVRLFRAAAQRGDYALIGKVGLAGVVIAPVCEEFLFRGFFYGVGKRFAGAWLSGLVTALLFAAFHASLTSMPGLFVLALAFTLAYERTGSLAVPVAMHAMFNATSLAILYAQSVIPVPA